MPLDPLDFRTTLARFASGVTVVTIRGADGQDHGMTVTAFTSLSPHPPLILICVDRAASMAGPLETTEHFAVHLLGEGQEALSRRFAETGSERFAEAEITRGIAELPLLDGALARLQCRITARHPGGDHVIIIGEVLDAIAFDGSPLLYFRSRYARMSP